MRTTNRADYKKRVLLGISWVTIMFENNMEIFINKLLIPNRFLPPDNYRDKALITSFGFVSIGMTLFIRCLRQMRRGHNSIS